MGLSQYMPKIGKYMQQKCLRYQKNFSVPLMSEILHQKVNHYDLQNPYESSIPNVNSVFHGVPLKQLLGNGSQATAHAGYVKHTLEIMVLFKSLVRG